MSGLVDASSDLDLILNRSTMIYGFSGSGKSTLMKHFMSLIGPKVSISIMLTDNKKTADIYEGIHPSSTVITNPVMDMIKNILKFQTDRASIYDFVNKKETLRSIFLMVATYTEQQKEKEVIKYCENRKSLLDEALIKFYKYVIRNNKAKLESSKDDNIKLVIKQLDFNASMAIFIDDATIFLSHLSKDSDGMDIFFRGRHIYLTLIASCHDETMASTKSRGGAFNSIFGDSKSLQGFIGRGTNRLSWDERVTMERYMSAMYKDRTDYTKLMMCREAPQQFYSLLAKPPINRIGCLSLWIVEEAYKKKSQNMITYNPLYKTMLSSK
jgi:energy-coupling factor transporter ATP-binding protein EcfA2